MSGGNTTQFIFAPEVRPDNRKYLLMFASFFWTVCLGCTVMSVLIEIIAGGAVTVLASPFLILAALLPNIALAFVIPRLQRFQRTHRYVLLGAFLAGAIIAIPPALVINTSLFLPIEIAQSDLLELIGYGTIAGIVEEGIKGLIVLFIYLRFRDEFHDRVDGVVIGALVGLGFAMTEDISYFIKGLEGGLFGLLVTVFLRLGLGWMNHSVFTAITGFAFGAARMGPQGPRRWLLPMGGYVLAAALHNTFNLLATILEKFAPDSLLGLVITIVPLYGLTWTVMGLLGFLVVRGWHQESVLVRTELQNETDQQVITTYEYLVVPSPGQRRMMLRDVQARAGNEARRTLGKIFQLQIALALQKRHSQLGDPPAVPGLHSESALRSRIIALRPFLAGVAERVPVATAIGPPPPLQGNSWADAPLNVTELDRFDGPPTVTDLRPYRLVVTAGPAPLLGAAVELRDGLTIGRSPAHAVFVLPDPEISGLHARISRQAGPPVLIDAESMNGSFVNGQRIRQQALRVGDQVRLGGVELAVEIAE